MDRTRTTYMCAVVAATLVGVAGSASAQVMQRVDAVGTSLAVPPPSIPETVQTVTAYGNSAGRVTSWVQRGYVGGVSLQPRLAWGYPGPAHYGAYEDDMTIIAARVGGTSVHFSPWIYQGGYGVYDELEEARGQWLEENGYVGGVRSVVNPISQAREVAEMYSAIPVRSKIVPRGTIQVPSRISKFRHEMLVRGDVPVRWSVPPHAAARFGGVVGGGGGLDHGVRTARMCD